MSRHRGSLQHLGGDRWRVRVFGGRTNTGKQITRSRSFRATDKRSAERVALRITGELLDELETARIPRGSIAELAGDWLDLKRRQGRSPSTIDGYRVIVDRIVERFGRMRIGDLTGRDIDRWYGELGDAGISPATVQHHHAVLRGMLRQAERWDLVGSVATRRSSPPSVDRPEISPPTTAALGVLLAAAGDGDFGMALRVMAGTGVRRGELLGLRWSDVGAVTVVDGVPVAELTVRRSVLERKGGGLLVKSTKSRKPRTLTVGGDVLDALARQMVILEGRAAAIDAPVSGDGFVFADLPADPSGQTPRRPGWLSHRWIGLRDAHQMVGVRLHDLRHWNATTLIDAGVPVPTVSERLGHAQVSTTLNIYSRRVAASDRAAAGHLAGLLGQPRELGPAENGEDPPDHPAEG